MFDSPGRLRGSTPARSIPHSAFRTPHSAGVALPLSLFALVVVGALVSGAFWVAVEEQRIGENQYRVERAFAAAEAGAVEIIRQWDRESLSALRSFPRDTYQVPTRALPGGTGSFEGRGWKLNPNLYLIDVTGGVTPGLRPRAPRARGSPLGRPGLVGIRQRIGALARIVPPEMETRAAFTTQGDVSLLAGAVIDGTDRVPNASWTSCASTDSSRAGLRTTGGASVSVDANASTLGRPPVMADPTLTDDAFEAFGEVTYDRLAALAAVRLAGGQRLRPRPAADGAGDCDKTVPTNWGDGRNRAGPCGHYAPIVHVAGDLMLAGVGHGQGILLVDGDLLVEGAIEYFGIVIAKGSVRTGPATSGMRIWGTVIARNSRHRITTLARATVSFSKCAISNALRAAGRLAPLSSRSLVNLDSWP